MRVSTEDLQSVTDEDLIRIAQSILFRGLNYFNLRVKGIVNKIGVNAGIHRNKLRNS